MEILQVFYSVFSSIVTALAVPNEFIRLGSPILGMIALVPLYIAVSGAKSFNKAGLYTGLQLFFTHILSSYWLGRFKDFAIFTLGASALTYFAFGYCFGNYLYAVFYYTDKKNPLKAYSVKSFSFSTDKIIYFASVWTIYEWFKSVGFLAYPWGTLFMTSYNWQTLKQIMSVTGSLGVSYLFSLFACVIAQGIILLPDVPKYKINNNPLKFYALTASYCMTLFVISVIFGMVQLSLRNHDRFAEKSMNVIMVQHNNNPWEGSLIKTIENSQIETMEALKEYEDEGKNCDLIVWNESSLAIGGFFPETYDKIYAFWPPSLPFKTFVEELGIPLLAGGPAHYPDDEKNALNAAILFDKTGKITDFYGKHHLVPFAEEIPFADSVFVQKFLNRLVGFSNGWTAGKYYVLFTIETNDGNKVDFSAPICFEDAFPDVCRGLYNFGSEIFVNITNDSWSATNSAELQHFVVASFRTIEYRTSMIRSCTSGYSAVINDRGQVIADMPLFKQAHLNTTVPIYKRSTTTYSRFGNWIMYIIFLYVVSYLLQVFFKTKREQNCYKIMRKQYENEIDIDK